MRKSGNRKAFFFLLAMLGASVGYSQQVSDIELIRDQDFRKTEYLTKARSFLWIGGTNPLVRYNPLSLGLGGVMYVYQNWISPHISAGCLYQPSCSEFSKTLILELGLVKGSLLTADRIMRCNRIAETDIPDYLHDPKSGKVRETSTIYRLRP